MSGRRYDPDEIARAVLSGETPKQVSLRLGCSLQTVSRVASECGIDLRRAKRGVPEWSQEDDRDLRRCAYVIARKMGRTATSCARRMLTLVENDGRVDD